MGNKGVHTMESVNKRFRILYIAVVGLVLVIIGLIVFSLFKPVESATTPGTCLPIDKGGTGCDGETLMNYLGAARPITYSTAEQLTDDVYVDGKPIYQRTFQGTITVAAIQHNMLLLPTGYVSSLIDSEGTWQFWTSGPKMSINSAAPGANITSYVISENGSVSLNTQLDGGRTNAPYEVTLRYTKL